MLIIESRKIEQNSKKLLREREHVVKLMENIDVALPMKKIFNAKNAEAGKPALKSPTPVEPLEPLKVTSPSQR